MTAVWFKETWRVLGAAPALWWAPIGFALFTGLVLPGDNATGLLLGWLLQTALTAGWVQQMRQALNDQAPRPGDFLEGVGRFFNRLLAGQLALLAVWGVVAALCLFGAYRIAGAPPQGFFELKSVAAAQAWFNQFTPEQVLVYLLFGGVFFAFWGLTSWYTLLWQSYVVLGDLGWWQAFQRSYQTVIASGWPLLLVLVTQFSLFAVIAQWAFAEGPVIATFGFLGQIIWMTYFTLLYAWVVRCALLSAAPTQEQILS